MKYFNICTKKTFESQGETKTRWLVCGTLKVLDDGKQFIELNLLPDVSFYVFEQKKREDKPQEETFGD